LLIAERAVLCVLCGNKQPPVNYQELP
jgi:hypothetical protein